MLVCRGCESALRFPILALDRKLSKCEVCFDRTLCSMVVVGK